MVAKKEAAKTTKKTTTKSKATSAASAKATKSAPAKKPAAKKSAAKATKAAPVQSFRLSKETEKFISSRITMQTVYWFIIGLAILAMGLVVLKAQLEILDTLNEISNGLY